MSRLKLNHTKAKMAVWTQVLEQKKTRIYRGYIYKKRPLPVKIGVAVENILICTKRAVRH